MVRTLVVALFLLCLMAAPPPARAVVEIKVDFGIADIMREAREWFVTLWTRSDEAERRAIEESVPRLVTDMLRMAAVMDDFADGLDRAVGSGERGRRPGGAGVAGEDRLRRDLGRMQALMQRILATADGLDAEWAMANVSLADRMFGVIQTRAGAVRDTVVLLESAEDGEVGLEAGEVAANLRKVAGMTREVAAEIAAVSTPGPQ
jgi:hypothetical protein